MNKQFRIAKSIVEFFLASYLKSEKYFYKSLKTYRKNYFSVIHSGSYNMDEYIDVVQYMLANTLNKKLSRNELCVSASFYAFCSKNLSVTNSQFLQDLFVLFFLNQKKNGYYVEFGACDGVDLSNTLILEQKLDWMGILAEPDIHFFSNLSKNRKAHCSNLAVYKNSGISMKFHHVVGDAKLSTFSEFSVSDIHKNSRNNKEEFDVSTITLNALLDMYNAPDIIDYVSIDTEGSEFEIIESFDFGSRRVLLWTIEHNHNIVTRKKLLDIMSKHSYKRVLEGFSECDDWFIDEHLYEEKVRECTKEIS